MISIAVIKMVRREEGFIDLLQGIPRSCFFSDQQTAEVAYVFMDPKDSCKFGQYSAILTRSPLPQGCPKPRENRYEEHSKVAHVTSDTLPADPAFLPSSLFYDLVLRTDWQAGTVLCVVLAW